jgi:alkanesulfonate monooxygenase SsuD/methylene tetrahydromethanopterin reductase-like flavin-dependent oxidoreductase (luciferase family)
VSILPFSGSRGPTRFSIALDLFWKRKEEQFKERRFLPHDEDLAVAFRSTVVAPKTIVELVKRLDSVRPLSHVFVPEGSQAGPASLDICSACLAVSERLHIGSGIIRILEHDPSLLGRRLLTLQQLSDNRFALGVGTGPAASDPKLTIRLMLDCLRLTRERFEKFAGDLPGVDMPETFIATLRRGIAKAAVGHSDGILLNFCPPEHARHIIRSLGDARRRLIVSCYLKIFYSKDEATANRMLIEEFAGYDHNPSYHEMFESVGVAQEIERAKLSLRSHRNVHPSENLTRISLANPTKTELAAYVGTFREAGVDLPCLYPYFEAGEDDAFKISKVEEMVRL